MQVQSPTNSSMLVQEEVALLASIYAQCCDPNDYTVSATCLKLQAAIAPNRTGGHQDCS
jgi:hypothetical protein